MSRRKQSNPRHLDGELEGGDLLSTGTTTTSSTLLLIPGNPTTNINESNVPTNQQIPPEADISDRLTDAHVCGVCREEFQDILVFMTHKQTCIPKRDILSAYTTEDDVNGNLSDYDSGIPNTVKTAPSDDLDSVGDKNSMDVDSSDQSDYDESSRPPSLLNDGKMTEEDDVDERYNSSSNLDEIPEKSNNEDNSIAKDMKSRTGNQLQQLLFPFAPFMQDTGRENVTLEPLANTSAAVAQFAENNLPPQDLAYLQSTLYSLQQQQIVQLQLIQHLQQQLLLGMSGGNGSHLPSGIPTLTPPNPETVPHFVNKLNGETSAVPSTSTSSLPTMPEGSKTNGLISKDIVRDIRRQTSTEEKDLPHEDALEKLSNSSRSGSSTSSSKRSRCKAMPSPSLAKLRPHLARVGIESISEFPDYRFPENCTELSDSSPPSKSSNTDTLAVTTTSCNLVTNNSNNSFHSCNMNNNETSGSTSTNSRLPVVSHTPPSVPNLPHRTRDPDSFFKHKCRLCYKVLGSDSALQIHMRSHTGERPFHCNVCGSRFSTRGNLKVHYDRHKENGELPAIHSNSNVIGVHHDDRSERKTTSPKVMPYQSPTVHHTHHHHPHPHPHHHHPHHHHHPAMFGLSTYPPLHFPGRDLVPSMTSFSNQIIPVPTAAMFCKSLLSIESSSPGITAISHPEESSQSHTASEAPPRCSPEVKETANTPLSLQKMTGPILNKESHPTSSPPPPLAGLTTTINSITSSIPSYSSVLPSIHPLVSPSILLPPMPDLPAHNPELVYDHSNPTIPPKVIEPGENMEMYMEIHKSETSKLEQLVKNIEQKITDPNECVICHRVLSCKSALQMHYRIHTGERPFRCKICGRSFTTKGNLKTHMGVHRAKPPMRMMHQCPVCHKQFTNLLVLQQHIRMHTMSNGGEPTIPANLPSFRPLHDWPPQLHSIADTMPLPSSSHRELDLSKSSSYNNNFLNDIVQPGGELDLSKPSARSDERSNDRDSPVCNDDEDMDVDEDDKINNETYMNVVKNSHNDDDVDDNDVTYDIDDISRQHSPSQDMNDIERADSVISSGSASQGSISPKPDARTVNAIPAECHYPPLVSDYSPLYSTSLAALEERVRSIDTYSSQPFFQKYMNGIKDPKPLQRPVISPQFDQMDRHSIEARESRDSDTPASNKLSHEEHILKPPPFHMAMTSPHPGFMLSGQDFSPLNLAQGGPDNKMTTTCDICFKTFACRSALDIHYRSHTKERPYQCEVCDRSFSTRGNMKQHMLTHKIRDLPSEAFLKLEPDEDSSESHVKNEDHGSPCPPLSDDMQIINLKKEPPTTDPSSSHTDNMFSSRADIRPSSHDDIKSSPSDSVTSSHSENKLSLHNDSLSSAYVENRPSSHGDNRLPTLGDNRPSSHGDTRSSSHGDTRSSSHGDNRYSSHGDNRSSSHGDSRSSHSDRNGNKQDSTESTQLKQENNESPFVRRSSSKHQCHVCLKHFSSGSALQIHMRTHTGDKPFKCNVCEKAFTTKGNLKVHMGTHMWNNSPSRRGRRMSIEPPPFMFSPSNAPKENPYLAAAAAAAAYHTPEFYFHYPPPFLNGLSPKMNEISVIQSLNGSMGYPPQLSAHISPVSNGHQSDDARPDTASPLSDAKDEIKSPDPKAPTTDYNQNEEPHHRFTSSGELDLSLKSSQSRISSPPSLPAASVSPASRSKAPLTPKTPPRDSTTPNNIDYSQSNHTPLHMGLPPWVWKPPSCHICSAVFSSPSSLDHHMRSQHFHRDESPQSLVT